MVQTTDFIVVGGGTAGQIIAKLLSKNHDVILFESGENADDDKLISDPKQNGNVVLNEKNEFFWGLGNSERDTNFQNFEHRLPRVCGGGSSVGGTLFTRGTDNYYRKLESYLEDSKWGPYNTLQTFKEIESFNSSTSVPIDIEKHGFEGPVSVRMGVTNSIEAENMATWTAALTGTKVINDYNNNDTPLGSFVYTQLTQKLDRSRESTSTAYSDDNSCGRDNLIIYKKSTVLKIIMDEHYGRAIGVNTLVNCIPAKFFANKGVILAAGINSATLLQISGVGDRDLLLENDIEVIVHNPLVGTNIMSAPLITTIGIKLETPFDNSDLNALYGGGAFVPDPTKAVSDPDYKSKRSVQIINTFFPNIAVSSIVLLQAVSRGYIKIRSKDPLKMPEYNLNMMDSTINNSPDIISGAFFLFVVQIVMILSGYSVVNIIDRNAYARFGARQSYNISGGCQMGKNIDEGVVNSEGKVFGVDNLYVCDASIFPFPPDAPTMGPTMLAAYNVANCILKEHVEDSICRNSPNDSVKVKFVSKKKKYSSKTEDNYPDVGNCYTCYSRLEEINKPQ